MLPKDAKSQQLLASYNDTDPTPHLGTLLNRTKCAMVATYDFSVNGGAVGTIPLLQDDGNPANLPKGAIVTKAMLNVITAPLSGGSATIAFGTAISAATGDLLAATAKASLTTGLHDGIPDGTAANAKGPVPTGSGAFDAGTVITATIAVAALTAGKIYVNIEYYINSLT